MRAEVLVERGCIFVVHLEELRDQAGRLEQEAGVEAALLRFPVQEGSTCRDQAPFDRVLQAFGGWQWARRRRRTLGGLDRWAYGGQQQHKAAPVFPKTHHQEASVSKNGGRCQGWRSRRAGESRENWLCFVLLRDPPQRSGPVVWTPEMGSFRRLF